MLGRRNSGLAAIALAILFAGCSTDSKAARLKFLKSGREYFEAGKYQEAVIQYRNAVQLDPSSGDARYRLALAYLRSHKPEPALLELTEAVRLDPANLDAQVELAGLRLIRREYDQAQAALEKVLAKQPGNARAHALLGQRYAAEHDVQGAAKELNKAIELDPARTEYSSVLGAILLADGKADEAKAVFLRAVERNPKSIPPRMDLIQFYISRRDLDRAETESRAAVDVEPGAIPPRLLRVEILTMMNKLPEAEALCRELKSVAPNDPQAYQALGFFYLSVGKPERALQEFRDLVGKYKQDVTAKQVLVELLTDLGRIVEAARLSDQMLKASPEDPRTLTAHGRVLIVQRRYQEALLVLQKAVSRQPLSADGHLLLGTAQKAVGLAEQARASLTRAAELAPQKSEARTALARMGTEGGNPDAALRLPENVSKYDPNYAAAQAASAEALLAKGKAREAEVRLKEALDRDPTSLQALSALLKAQMAQGKAQEAVRFLTELAKRHPGNAGVHLMLALAYFSTGDVAMSEASLGEATRLDPGIPQAQTLRANLYFAKGANEDGKKALRAAITASPRSLSNYLLLEQQYEREGNWAEAKKVLESARKADPHSPVVANQLAYLYLEHGGDPNAALTLALEAKQKMPDSPNVADTLGWAYYKAGRTDSAIAELRRCVSMMPGNPTCQYHLGMALLAANDHTAAQQLLQRALNTPNFLYTASAREALAKIRNTRANQN